MAKYSITKYIRATIIDEYYDISDDLEPSPFLDQILADHGECENDVILQVEPDKAWPVYKWSRERCVWQMVQ